MAAAWWGRVCRTPVSETDLADMRATLCRQNSCLCLLWRRLYPFSQANQELLGGCLQLVEPNFAWAWYSVKDKWSTTFPRDKNIHFLIYQPLFWRFGNCFLKPVIESGWFQGQRERILVSPLRFVPCLDAFPPISLLSLTLFTIYTILCSSRVRWSDLQGENHCSDLKPYLANRVLQLVFCSKLYLLWPLCGLLPSSWFLWVYPTEQRAGSGATVLSSFLCNLQAVQTSSFSQASFLPLSHKPTLSFVNIPRGRVSLALCSVILYYKQDWIITLGPYSFCVIANHRQQKPVKVVLQEMSLWDWCLSDILPCSFRGGSSPLLSSCCDMTWGHLCRVRKALIHFVVGHLGTVDSAKFAVLFTSFPWRSF